MSFYEATTRTAVTAVVHEVLKGTVTKATNTTLERVAIASQGVRLGISFKSFKEATVAKPRASAHI